MEPAPNQSGFLRTLIADGRPLLALTAVALLFSGAFALFLSATKHFLPHDVAFLGMTAEQLCSLHECRIVHFMIHDRVSFGGSLIGISALYLWLINFPLRQGEPWAWWTLLVSGILGFATFLSYLGYGYLDTWHGAGTLVLLPCFACGLALFGSRLKSVGTLRPSFRPVARCPLKSRAGIGRALLLFTAANLALGGLIIMGVGMTTVFVPQDLEFMGLDVRELRAINPRLIPLIAHDRAGFGGGVCCTGITMFLCIWRGTPSRALWQALLITGLAGFGTAIGIHPAIGYNSFVHLAPAYLGAAMFLVGLALSYGPMSASMIRAGP